MKTIINQHGVSSMSLDQTIFNRVAAHLLAQGRPSLSDNEGECAYRGEDDLRCAVGCLIDDAHYSEALEGYSVQHGDVVQAVKSSLGLQHLAPRTADLLGDLQLLHDLTPPEEWREGLKALARQYDLELTV